MRVRISTAATLALAIFVSPAAALACEWQCARPAATSERAIDGASAAVEGSCHEMTDTPADTDSRVGTNGHDCAAHIAQSATPATLTKHTRDGGIDVLTSVPSAVAAPQNVGLTSTWPTAASAAPTGRHPGLQVPLRI